MLFITVMAVRGNVPAFVEGFLKTGLQVPDCSRLCTATFAGAQDEGSSSVLICRQDAGQSAVHQQKAGGGDSPQKTYRLV